MVQGLHIEFQSIPCEKEAPLHVNVTKCNAKLIYIAHALS